MQGYFTPPAGLMLCAAGIVSHDTGNALASNHCPIGVGPSWRWQLLLTSRGLALPLVLEGERAIALSPKTLKSKFDNH